MKPRNATRRATRSRTRSCSPSRKDVEVRLFRLIDCLMALRYSTDFSGGPISSTDTVDGLGESSIISITVTSAITTLMDTIASLDPGCKLYSLGEKAGHLQMTDGSYLEWSFVRGEEPEAMSWSARPPKPFRNSRGSTRPIGCRSSSRKSKDTPKGPSPFDRSLQEGMM